MVRITLDGNECEVPASRTIMEAARDKGIDIPHFCWHPRLSVSGNCRMCLVEVEGSPKLVIACATRVADGMVVHTANPRVIRAREAVMEFLLINHPLDCPICDEAGECKLQDYAYRYGSGAGRFDEDKLHKPKRVELGPRVLLDAERCILCSRCVRFCEEVARRPQLTFIRRGDHVELTVFPGDQLDNPYSMNTIDICPVGALTSRDFRFRARVWEMSATETVCPGCARNCSMYAWVRNNEILRQTPRFNPAVNDHWMCDAGRLGTFPPVHSDRRLKGPMMRLEEGLREVGWDEALARVGTGLRSFRKSEVAALGSAYASNEDNYVLFRFVREVLGTKHLDVARHVVAGDEDEILIRADKTPNARGALLAGIRPAEGGWAHERIIQGVREGQIKALLVMEDNPAADPSTAEALAKLEFLAVLSAWDNETTALADVVLSASTWAEKHGTFTNADGHVQRFRPSVATLEQDRASDGFSMSRLDRFGTTHDRWGRGLKRDARPSWKILAGLAAAAGSRFRYGSAEEVFLDIAGSVPEFRGMTYLKLGTRGMALAPPPQGRERTGK
ncbi:MAG: 2Fe-2S iron-sulfur cluster-binding protein [Bacteroidota bacterium]